MMTANDTPAIWRRTSPINSSDLGGDGELTAAALVGMLQEGASRHADELGVGLEYLLDNGLTWMLSRMRLSFGVWPEPADTLTITTWPAGSRRGMIALREYQCHDQHGALVAEATSDWLLVDTRRERITRLTPEIMTLDQTQTRLDESPQFPRTATEYDPQWSVAIPVRRSDLDINRHVNNIHYVSWLYEPLPEEWQRHRLSALDIAYRQAAKHGDTVISQAAELETSRLYHRIIRQGDGVVLCEAHSQWRSTTPAAP